MFNYAFLSILLALGSYLAQNYLYATTQHCDDITKLFCIVPENHIGIAAIHSSIIHLPGVKPKIGKVHLYDLSKTVQSVEEHADSHNTVNLQSDVTFVVNTRFVQKLMWLSNVKGQDEALGTVDTIAFKLQEEYVTEAIETASKELAKYISKNLHEWVESNAIPNTGLPLRMTNMPVEYRDIFHTNLNRILNRKCLQVNDVKPHEFCNPIEVSNVQLSADITRHSCTPSPTTDSTTETLTESTFSKSKVIINKLLDIEDLLTENAHSFIKSSKQLLTQATTYLTTLFN